MHQASARTTVTASVEDLDTLRGEARRRGVPVSVVLGEAVAEKARALRQRRRPRVAVARSTDDRSAREVASEPVAPTPR